MRQAREVIVYYLSAIVHLCGACSYCGSATSVPAFFRPPPQKGFHSPISITNEVGKVIRIEEKGPIIISHNEKYFGTTKQYRRMNSELSFSPLTFHSSYGNNRTSDNDQIESENSTDNQSHDLASSIMIGAIKTYKEYISPLLLPACRFQPTCSQYGLQAIEEYGPSKGFILIAWRLARCTPLGGRGYDPPQWPPVPYNFGSY